MGRAPLVSSHNPMAQMPQFRPGLILRTITDTIEAFFPTFSLTRSNVSLIKAD